MHKKIDIYADGKYVFPTMQSKTCKEAVRKVQEKINSNRFYFHLSGKKISANFAK